MSLGGGILVKMFIVTIKTPLGIKKKRKHDRRTLSKFIKKREIEFLICWNLLKETTVLKGFCIDVSETSVSKTQMLHFELNVWKAFNTETRG